MWWSGNLYEALVISPAWLASWRREQTPGVRIDPRLYYLPASPATGVAADVRPVFELHALSLTGYLVATVNLELFFRDPPPPAARGLALMQRWVKVNLVRLLVVTVVLGATARACSELVRFSGAG